MELIITLIVLIIIWCVAFMVGNKQGANRIVNQIKKDGGYFDMEITGAVYPYKTSSLNDENVKGYFQQLAGITPVEMAGSVLPTNLTTKKLNEHIVEALLKAAENSEFPKPDESINVLTQKIYTIDRTYSSDALEDLPMSRVSKETKEQIAEMVKADITKQVEDKVNQIKPKKRQLKKDNIETKSDNNKK